jgi:Bacterial protein of unknown function (DUF899)
MASAAWSVCVKLWNAAMSGISAIKPTRLEPCGSRNVRTVRVEEQRRELPWVPVEREYRFATEDGPKSLADLFEGRSQLLIYHLMFGEDWAGCVPRLLVSRRRADGRRAYASERS